MKITNVEVRVISQAEGKDDNSYRDIDNLAHHKKPNPIIVLLYIKWKKPKTKSNNCFIIDFKPKIINVARKTIKNKPRRHNMQMQHPVIC